MAESWIIWFVNTPWAYGGVTLIMGLIMGYTLGLQAKTAPFEEAERVAKEQLAAALDTIELKKKEIS